MMACDTTKSTWRSWGLSSTSLPAPATMGRAADTTPPRGEMLHAPSPQVLRRAMWIPLWCQFIPVCNVTRHLMYTGLQCEGLSGCHSIGGCTRLHQVLLLQYSREMIHAVPERTRLRQFHHDQSVCSHCIAQEPMFGFLQRLHVISGNFGTDAVEDISDLGLDHLAAVHRWRGFFADHKVGQPAAAGLKCLNGFDLTPYRML